MHNFQNLSNPVKGALALVFIILIGLGGYFLYTKESVTGEPVATNETNNPLDGIDLSTITGTTTVGDYTITPVPVEENNRPQYPAIERSYPATSANISGEGRVQAIANLNVTVAELKKDPYVYESWIDLGTLRQLLGDYTGASQAWEYATKLNIQQPLAFYNLANLNAVYVKDYAKAEVNFQKAISISPSNPALHRALFEFYRDVYKKGTSAAEDAIKAGIAKVPSAVDLRVLLARFYRDAGRKAEAKVQYEAAISAATAQGQRELVSSIQAELTAMGN